MKCHLLLKETTRMYRSFQGDSGSWRRRRHKRASSPHCHQERHLHREKDRQEVQVLWCAFQLPPSKSCIMKAA